LPVRHKKTAKSDKKGLIFSPKGGIYLIYMRGNYNQVSLYPPIKYQRTSNKEKGKTSKTENFAKKFGEKTFRHMREAFLCINARSIL